MNDIILKVESVSKQYRLGLVGTGTLSHDLNRWWHKIRGKEDPYLKIGEANDRSTKGTSEYVWALQNINFEVRQGEVLGIIGKNGAGKSTLLKILSKVTSPTTGEIKTKGRIASLLEVGTGFHGEMTGRENIFLNGAILGMTKKEIASKIDNIIEFSGCERYIDTPVKRYSSGMTVRLAFAVAAFLEPEILVIDEVLAVGDAEFQKKAIGKMQDLSQGEGRTVLFVSHNMAAVQNLCTRCIVLENGNISFTGSTVEAIKTYLDIFGKRVQKTKFPVLTNEFRLDNFYIQDKDKNSVFNLMLGNKYSLKLTYKNLNVERELNFRFQVFDKNDDLITTMNTYHTSNTFKMKVREEVIISCIIEKLNLSPGEYNIYIEIIDLYRKEVLLKNARIMEFYVENADFYNTGKLPSIKYIGKFLSEYKWECKNNDIT